MKRITILLAFLVIGFVLSATIITKDTTILKNDTLRLNFNIPNFECVTGLLFGPSNYTYVKEEMIFQISVPGYIIKYTFAPKISFIGSDTIFFHRGCHGTSGFTISDTLRYIITSKGVDIVDTKSRIKLFPNPSNGEIHIIGLSLEAPFDFKLYDSSGKLCQKGLFSGKCINTKVKDGIYILRISRANNLLFEDKVKIYN